MYLPFWYVKDFVPFTSISIESETLYIIPVFLFFSEQLLNTPWSSDGQLDTKTPKLNNPVCKVSFPFELFSNQINFALVGLLPTEHWFRNLSQQRMLDRRFLLEVSNGRDCTFFLFSTKCWLIKYKLLPHLICQSYDSCGEKELIWYH